MDNDALKIINEYRFLNQNKIAIIKISYINNSHLIFQYLYLYTKKRPKQYLNNNNNKNQNYFWGSFREKKRNIYKYFWRFF